MLKHFLIALLVVLGFAVSSPVSAAHLVWQCVATNDGHAPARWYSEAHSLHHARLGALNACAKSGLVLHANGCSIVQCRIVKTDTKK